MLWPFTPVSFLGRKADAAKLRFMKWLIVRGFPGLMLIGLGMFLLRLVFVLLGVEAGPPER